MSDQAVLDVEVRPKSSKPESTKPKPKRQPRYVVIILNDDKHTFDYVVEILLKVFNKSLEEAIKLTIEIHNSGRGQVWIGTRELAELKVEQTKNFGDDLYAGTPVKFPLGCYTEPLPQ